MMLFTDLLFLIRNQLDIFEHENNFINCKAALIGGLAVAAHGFERSTGDIDLLYYAEPYNKLTDRLFEFLSKKYPEEVALYKMSSDPDDPLKHDLIKININNEEIDILIASYKWEIEALNEALFIEGIPFPIVNKIYLIALKLIAGGPKDKLDIMGLINFLTSEEKEKTFMLAGKIKQREALDSILNEMNKKRPRPPAPDLN